ncbi:lipopolysaccharide biosynthesis protein [Novosphingobium profundi]|uniref:lipopolysaccharide biosynthesis protein n=1 Tax=Novosphingobium profundi TaxID=1774954 RepID=UPI001BD98DB2|nr:lipopolysaccharide biosynthesis protein [Novosphingobium profundi]MBT0668355.1 lipopolysaccharide biosynthesis protein [Novosphingobium profundi]
MKKRVLMGIVAMGYSKGVVALMQLVMVPVLAKTWGLTLYGQWLILASVPMFMGASDLGFGLAASNRFIAESANKQDREALTTFHSALLLISICGATLVALSYALCLLLPDSTFRVEGGLPTHDARITLALLCTYAVVALYMPLMNGVSRSVGKLAKAVSIVATGQMAEGLGVIAAALLGAGAIGAAAAMLAVRVSTISILSFTATRHAGWAHLGIGQARFQRIKDLTRPAFAAMVLPLSQAAFLQGTAFAVGLAGTPAMVPLYTTLRTLSRIGLQVMSAIAIPVMPEFAIARARGDNALASRIGGMLTMGCAAVGLGATLTLSLFGVEIIHLWTGGVVQPPYLMVLIFGIGIGLDLLWAPLSDLLLAVNRHETYSYTYLVSAFLVVGLTYVLVQRFGVVGAAAANLCLEIVMFLTVTLSLRRNFGRFEYDLHSMLDLLPGRRRKSAKPG